MDLMARIKGLLHRHDERLAEQAMKAPAAGRDDAALTPGLDRHIEDRATSHQQTTEHQEPQ